MGEGVFCDLRTGHTKASVCDGTEICISKDGPFPCKPEYGKFSIFY